MQSHVNGSPVALLELLARNDFQDVLLFGYDDCAEIARRELRTPFPIVAGDMPDYDIPESTDQLRIISGSIAATKAFFCYGRPGDFDGGKLLRRRGSWPATRKPIVNDRASATIVSAVTSIVRRSVIRVEGVGTVTARDLRITALSKRVGSSGCPDPTYLV